MDSILIRFAVVLFIIFLFSPQSYAQMTLRPPAECTEEGAVSQTGRCIFECKNFKKVQIICCEPDQTASLLNKKCIGEGTEEICGNLKDDNDDGRIDENCDMVGGISDITIGGFIIYFSIVVGLIIGIAYLINSLVNNQLETKNKKPKEDVKFCDECGNEINKNQKFCTKCCKRSGG